MNMVDVPRKLENALRMFSKAFRRTVIDFIITGPW